MHYGQHALQVEELARSAPVVAQANAFDCFAGLQVGAYDQIYSFCM